MRFLAAVFLFVALSAPATAQAAAVVEVHLSNFKFEPKSIKLNADRDYALTLTNESGGGHSLEAKEFFALAKVDSADMAMIKDGKVEVPGSSSRTIHFRTAGPGTYKVKCTHAFHSGFGMKGEIVVR